MTPYLIDKTAELDAIKQKYGERYISDWDAIREAAELWGVDCNRHGMITDCHREVLAQKGGCKAEFLTVMSSKGYWLSGLDARSAYNGFGCMPSVWDRVAFSSHQNAKLAAIDKFTDFFNEVVNSNDSCNSAKNRSDAKQIVALLQAASTPQMTLF